VTRPLVLVTGGARSGKTRFALATAQRWELPLVYLATAQAGDVGMAERIAKHRAERDARWRTIEEPLEVAQVLASVPDSAVLLDCLTLWLSNVLLASTAALAAGSSGVPAAIDELCGGLAARRSAIVCVTNEVGSGVVPETPLGRRFRDEQGWLNQRVADLADEVYLLVAGRPLQIK
jgi:adenosylcobinamide kinase/adenosylcobinamide-phosphate guanylyltransferase